MQFQVSDKKVAKLKTILDSAIQDGFVTFRNLAKISVNSIYLTVGPIARLLTRQMYAAIDSRPSWDSILPISSSLMVELTFWYLNIDCFNGYSIRPPPTSSVVIFTDASNVAFWGFSSNLSVSSVSGMWLADDKGQSSTYRELKAIYYVLASYAKELENTKVKVFTDNDNAARIVLVGSRKPHLQALTIDIFQLCLAKRIVRSVNERVDLLSRFVDKDDWSLNPVVFQDIDVKWGPHTVDRFASYYNAQLPRFNSKFASPSSCGADAFSQDWSCEINWICPPVSLIVRPVRKLEA